MSLWPTYGVVERSRSLAGSTSESGGGRDGRVGGGGRSGGPAGGGGAGAAVAPPPEGHNRSGPGSQDMGGHWLNLHTFGLVSELECVHGLLDKGDSRRSRRFTCKSATAGEIQKIMEIRQEGVRESRSTQVRGVVLRR